MRLLYTIVIFGCVLYGQNSDRVFSFTHVSTAEDFQQIANVLRAVGNLKQVSVDSQAKTLTVNGTTQQIDLANWLFHSVDIEPRGSTPSPLEYTVPGGTDDVARVFFVAGEPAPKDLQQLVNALRTITEIRYMYQLIGIHGIAMRGTAIQVTLAEWILNALISPTPGKVEYIIPGVQEVPPRWSPGVVRVFHVAHATSAQDLQDLINALRTITDIAQIYQHVERGAIVVRGNSTQIPLADWLMEKLDQLPGQQPAVERYQVVGPMMPDTREVRVFSFPQSATAETVLKTVTVIRMETGQGKIYACPALRAIVMRATPAQALQAETMMAKQ